MCGLAAVISRSSVETARDAVETMLAAEVHRGPDSSGSWAASVREHAVSIGLRRLRILDLSVEADQPMLSRDGRYALVFNGEIYNYVELRRELEREGARFRTSGDTEVLLEALIRWRTEAFNRLNGMWAIVLVDTVEGDVLIARDRFGVKPLYTYTDGRTIWIASEIKSILASCGHKFRVNPAAVKLFLRQGLLDTGGATFLEGIQEFPAGHFARRSLTAGISAFEPEAFWKTPTDRPEPLPLEELIEAVRETFVDAVRIRLRSDVPVGVLLSGGCDSSAIAAAVHHLDPSRKDIRLISAVSDTGVDERPFIDAMARHIGRSVDTVVLNYTPAEAFDLISEAVWYNDEPIGGFSSIAHYLLMKRAAELRVTVLLSGQGADECLCGYKKYLGFYLHELVRGGRLLEAGRVLAGFVRNGTVISQFTLSKGKNYLPSWLRAAEIDFTGPAVREVAAHAHLGLNGYDVRGRQALDIESLSVPALVHYEDRMSMSSSREIRLPFLDYRLVSLLVPAPVEHKLHDGWTKWILRRAMEPLLPAEIAWRKDKQGFLVPQQTWLRTVLREQMRQFLNEPWLSDDLGLVKRSSVRELFESYLRRDHAAMTLGDDDFFPAISLELWARRFSSWLAT
jgi:asparagine synthase (glutamine-hydrolysing)